MQCRRHYPRLVFCQSATPERETVSVQLIDDTIHIRNVEAY
jgi:hypothetical protein